MISLMFGLGLGLGTALTVAAIAIIASCTVLKLGLKAIEKSPPDNVPQVIAALATLLGSFRWIGPWHQRSEQAPRREAGSSKTREGSDGI